MSGLSSISQKNNIPSTAGNEAVPLQNIPIEVLVNIFKNIGNLKNLEKACNDPKKPSSYPLNIKLALESKALVNDRINIILETENCTDLAAVARKLELNFRDLSNIESHTLIMEKYEKEFEFYKSYKINASSCSLGQFHNLTADLLLNELSQKLQQCRKDYTLIEFWKALKGSNWIDITSIDSLNDIVTSQEFPANTFQGMFASELQRKGQYQYFFRWDYFIDLTDKNLKELPPEINLFTNMRKLSLGDNQLTDISILDLTKLTQLKQLLLNNNKIDDISHFNGSSITNIYAPNNSIESIAGLNMPNLRYLTISNNKITKIDNLSLLQIDEIYANNNKINEITANNQLQNLGILELNGNLLDSFPALNLPNIAQLHLERNLFTKLPQLPVTNGGIFIKVHGNKISQIPENYNPQNQLLEIHGLFSMPLTFKALWNGRALFYKVAMPFKAMHILYALIMRNFLKVLYMPFTLGKIIFFKNSAN